MRARREHPLRATLRIAEQGLRAGDLATPDPWKVSPEWSCREAADRMDEFDFDVAPLDEDPLRSFVSRKNLREADPGRTVAALAQPIDASLVVTADLGLADTLALLEKRDFLFVIEGDSVFGLITLSDLQRVPVGMTVLAIILATEAGLNQLIRQHYGKEGFLDHLPKGRRQKTLERYDELKGRNLETDLVDVLFLADRLHLVGTVQRFRQALGFGSRERFKAWKDELERLRNTLAHGGTILDHEPEAHRALALIRRVRGFAEDVWKLAELEAREEGPNDDPARDRGAVEGEVTTR
ncbi:MAG TPA: CBS domain-containing protein [Actinomycetota bacterium]|nr:CBS domain-containing protein [Actinomycetota bacterium]